MINVAILGFGVVGGGVADLLTANKNETERLGGDNINIKYILDLRDFPDSHFSDRVIHDYNLILEDKEIDVVIEVMGGSHPAYEYTVGALKRGKNVITSNKEVVAKFGDEFLKLAEENGVSYRFEAAVGGGIPVISPIISCVCQNKISEVRGILNGTTNYILTEMFSYGKSFSSALSDAQKKGYAESNPDADVLGIDAARKIAILTALVSGKLIDTDNIHTEGITSIRDNDVKAAELLGCTIKLVGRGIISEEGELAMVAPFMVPSEMPLSSVSGVYNAVEVIGEPLGNVMFYGRGAGAGATASAVVGDLMQLMRSGRNCKSPEFEKIDDGLDFLDFSCSSYLALDESSVHLIKELIPSVKLLKNEDEYAALVPEMKEKELDKVISLLPKKPFARIRLLK